MKLVHKDKAVQLPAPEVLVQVPTAPTYFTAAAKKHFKAMAEILVNNKTLKAIHIPALEIYALNREQLEYAVREIHAKNKLKPGKGWIQKYGSGATNISTEVVLRNNAESTLFKCFKQFGLDPRSEKELKQAAETGQFDLFDDYMAAK